MIILPDKTENSLWHSSLLKVILYVVITRLIHEFKTTWWLKLTPHSSYRYIYQGFPQKLRTWGCSSKFDGEGFSQYKGEHGGGQLKTLLQNASEGLHLSLKLSPISLQAYKFIKNELLHTYFSRILARF